MKSPLIGVRIPEEIKEKLDKIAAEYHDMNTSQIARTAITEWVESQWLRHEDMMVMPKSNIADLLEMLPSEKLNEFEEKVVAKVMMYFDYLTINKHKTVNTIKDFMEEMIKFIGNTGMRWFERMEIQIEGQHRYFKGMHSLGMIWSQVFLDIFKKIIQKHAVDFHIKEDSIKLTEKYVYFEFSNL
jgi:metal-responsive CopG/Arc/MetJ family transcriptional regulator